MLTVYIYAKKARILTVKFFLNIKANLSNILENIDYNVALYNGTFKLYKSVDNKKIKNIIKNIKP